MAQTAPAEEKRECRKCGKTKLIEEFLFRNRKRGWRAHTCRACWAESRRRAERTPVNPIVDGLKKCSKCESVKPVAEFSFDKNIDDYTSVCKACVNECGRRKRRVRLGLPLDAPPLRPQSHPVGAVRLHARSGYLLEKAPGHHRARNGWVFQHILVAEQKYGFPIPREFTVHHRNDDRADNRPENLELRVGNHGRHGDVIPTLLKHPELRAIARTVLAQYED